MDTSEKAGGTDRNWASAVRTGTRGVTLIGYLAILLFAGAFSVWASTAPLSGAAIAQGVVAASGQNQVVQHLEGGIIRKIHVREGERVEAGAPLFTMDGTRSRATLNTLEKQWVNLRARAARLTARRDGKGEVTFDEDLVAKARAEGLETALDEQRSEFRARLTRYRSELVILKQRVDAANETITGFESQKQSLEEQLAVVKDEADRKKTLLDKGLTNRSEYTLLLRSQAELVGQIGSITSQISQAKTRIVEAEEQLVRQKTSRIEDSLRELNDVNASLGEVEEQLDAARDVLDRLVVRAPSDGIIIRLSQNTPGSVVQPGGDLAEILPTSSELIIEARLSPADIDLVRPDQQARLRFVALNARRTPEVPGTVTYISPDRFIDRATQQPFYIARLKIDETLPDGIERDQIYPGMPVEAMISTDERTFFSYLVKPITDSFARAFREQ